MGRFDALTQIEDTEQPKTSSPVVSSPISKIVTTQQIKQGDVDKQKPEITNARNHETPPPISQSKEKPVKYSTLLDPALVKKIKLVAAEKEIKDYEVIEKALSEYFAKEK